MRNLFFLIIYLFISSVTSTVLSQDFSNKGKDFWLGYGYHVNMQSNGIVNTVTGGSQDMVLYFTSDKNATVTVDIPAVGYKQVYVVIANQVTETGPLPKIGTQDARIADAGIFNTGIHIYSDVSIVAYAHIYANAVSGASLLFPTNTLGKDYYSINYNQSSNSNFSNSFFFVVATEDNTTVEITPSAANTNGLTAGQPFIVTLNKGQIYNVMGTTSGRTGTDLTGSRIRSINTGGSSDCKKIAVFSGSGKISIGGTQAGTADNLFQQAFPSAAWGLKYLTAPTGSQPNNFYRVCVKDPSTVVKLNGVVLPLSSLQNNFFYEFKNSNNGGAAAPNLIEADKPVLVSQYCTTQGQEGNPGSPGDPEMIYLSPIEQTINSITLNSTYHYNITQHYINVIIGKGGVSSFTLDGVSQAGRFQPHPQDANYAYAILNVSTGSHSVYSDSGFNSIAYGFGNAESYGYNAGTNIKDLNLSASFQNPYGRVDSAISCVNNPFQFSFPINQQPVSIAWDFSAAPNISPNAPLGPIQNPVADSTPVVNGTKIYYFGNHTVYTFLKANNSMQRDTIKVFTTTATPDGCGSNSQTYLIPVKVVDYPSANFTVKSTGCVTDSVYLNDASDTHTGSRAVSGLWNFDDGTTDSSVHAIKKFANPQTYQVRYRPITTYGCIGDTTIPLILSGKPVPKFSLSEPLCENSAITIADASTLNGGSFSFWIWNYNNHSDTLTTNAPRTTTYAGFGLYPVLLKAVTNTGCTDSLLQLVNIGAVPQVGFRLPEVCLSDALANFSDTSKIADGTGSLLTYMWNFDVNPNHTAPYTPPSPISSTEKIPSIKFFKADYYQVLLKVTSGSGCEATVTQTFTVNGAKPKSDFSVQGSLALCSNDSVRIQNNSTVDFGSVTKVQIYWDFGNNPTQSIIDDNPYLGKIYSHRYADFQSPAAQSYQIKFVAFSGGVCGNEEIKTITVNRSPKTAFSIMPGICNEASARQITQASETGNVPAGYFIYTGTGVNSNGLYDPRNLTPGTYPVKYLFVSDQGCRDSATQNITIWPSPQAKWGISSPACEKNNITFTDSSVANYSHIISWNWNYGDNNTQSRNKGNPFTYQYPSANIYSVSLQVITDSGCVSGFNAQAIKINYLPNVSFSLPGTICLPDGKGRFMDQSTIADGSAALFTYRWNFFDPNDPSPSVLQNPVHQYSALGPYNVQLKVTTKDGCIDSLTRSVTTIYPQPKANFDAVPSYVCVNDSVSFTDKSNGITGVPVQWFWDMAGTASGQQNPARQFTDSGAFNISLHIFNAQGCISDTAIKQVTVYPYPKLILGPGLYVLEGGNIKIKPQYFYGNGLQFLWAPSLYLNSDTAIYPVTAPLDDITYTLKLTGDGGCSVTDNIFIKVLRSPTIPNSFSPNGDGINDTWVIKYLDSYPGAVVDVYSRSGQLVLHAVNYQNDWGGTINGKPLPIGTYYYIINPKNGRPAFSGSVTIIK